MNRVLSILWLFFFGSQPATKGATWGPLFGCSYLLPPLPLF